MSVTNTGALSKALMPGVREFFGNSYNRYPDQYSKIFDVKSSSKNFEEDVNMHGQGLGAVVPEGTDITYAAFGQGGVQRYVNVKYGKGYIVTEEQIEDNQYPQVISSMSDMLGQSMKQVKETVGANILNRANNGSYTGWDGVSLSSASHLMSGGGTYSNQLAAAANLSEASLEQALINIKKLVDDSGLKIAYTGQLLVIPPELEFIAQRILDSKLKNDTAENAINVLNAGGYLSMGWTVNNYLSSSSKWFVKTNCSNGLMHFLRRPLRIDNDTVFDSGNMKFKMTERYSFGWTDPRGMYFNGE